MAAEGGLSGELLLSSSAEDSGDVSEGNDTATSDSTFGDGSVDCFHGYSSSDVESEISEPVPTSLHWMRMSALRIHDNPALKHAIQDPETCFRCVFILDPWFISGNKTFGINRWRFLLECLHDIDKRLRSYNSRLYVVQGQPVLVLERLFQEWDVRQLTFQQDLEPHSIVVESNIERLAQSMNVEVRKFSSHTLYDLDWVQKVNGGKPVMTQKAFTDLLPNFGSPPPPVASPSVPVAKLVAPCNDTEALIYRIPSMADLGYPSCLLYTNSWVGGETEALRRVPLYCQLRSQQATNTVDILFDKSSMSPYVRFGCLSVRYFLWKVKALSKKNQTFGRVLSDLTKKLLEREFYFIVSAQVPNYDITEKNPICLQIPWEHDPAMFQLWRDGRTGYPWIDSAMRQLQKEGWIHYCLRESVAVFLTRGDLWISWVKGKETFEELLLDYEPTVACSLWMRSSCSAFLKGPIQHYCPISFGKKIDPQGQFIRTYCPELKDFPSEFIYTPWLAPHSVQQAAGCLIGTHYPHPVVDHFTAGALCCERLRSVMNLIHTSAPPPPPSLPLTTPT